MTSRECPAIERDECLNENWFVGLVDARDTIEAWRLDYETVRPHSGLDQTKAEFWESVPASCRFRGVIVLPSLLQ